MVQLNDQTRMQLMAAVLEANPFRKDDREPNKLYRFVNYNPVEDISSQSYAFEVWRNHVSPAWKKGDALRSSDAYLAFGELGGLDPISKSDFEKTLKEFETV